MPAPRRVRTWEWDTSASTKVLRERFVYGDSLADTGVYDPADDHLRGRLYRVYDTAGFVEMSYDFKGNVLSTARRFFDDDEEDVDWQSFDPVAYPFAGDDKDTVAVLHDGDGGTNPGGASLLEASSETLTVSDTFDAINRLVTRTAPDNAVTTNTYDEGGMLEAIDVDGTSYVDEIRYNARGQRTLVDWGNGTETAYTYETDTFRLSTLVTTRASDSKQLQNLTYTYDPVGNITRIDNAADDDVYFGNAIVTPDQTFTYDALYRLTNATGREKSARGQADWVEPTYGPVPDTSETMQSYEQRYTYDDAGNITEMRHLLSGTTDWVRTYTYETTSNRLSTTTESAGTASYQHDDRGNMVFMPHLYDDGATPSPSANITPNFRDQMVKAQLDASNYELYFYDYTGNRVRKTTKKSTVVDERRYVAGYELWTSTTSGTLQEERTTLHIMDGERRVAMIETKTVSGGSTTGLPVSVARYQLDNHLGTAVVELNGSAQVISYEEYHPYGTTAWWAGDSSIEVSLKRYRYTGKEKDEETGLYYHGARYMAPWLGRWTSADPIGLGDGPNRYMYVRCRPTALHDPSGHSSSDPVPDAEPTRPQVDAGVSLGSLTPESGRAVVPLSKEQQAQLERAQEVAAAKKSELIQSLDPADPLYERRVQVVQEVLEFAFAVTTQADGDSAAQDAPLSFDVESGELVWHPELSKIASSEPMTLAQALSAASEDDLTKITQEGPRGEIGGFLQSANQGLAAGRVLVGAVHLHPKATGAQQSVLSRADVATFAKLSSATGPLEGAPFLFGVMGEGEKRLALAYSPPGRATAAAGAGPTPWSGSPRARREQMLERGYSIAESRRGDLSNIGVLYRNPGQQR